MKGVMAILIALLASIAIYLATRKREEVDRINICRPCYEKRYVNQWLGYRTHKGMCEVCKQVKIVDSIPMGRLQRKGE